MSTTPILDLEIDPPKPQRLRASAAFALVVLFVLIFLPLLASTINPHVPPFNGLLWLPAIYVAVAVHEAGHMVAGKLAGIGSRGLSVGGFMLYKSGAGWKLRFDGRQRPLGFAIPRATKDEFRRAPFAWYVAGGPIASILFVLLCTLGFLNFGAGAWNWIGALLWAAILPLTSLIPLSASGTLSDAARLWQLVKHPERSRQ